jgi:prepilin-type N-terminal cleavage/methylation domain-containing protein
MILAMKARGFSLLELLCTVAILAILTALIAGHGSASNDKKARIACEKNLEKIYLAFRIYSGDNSGAFPDLNGASNSEPVLSLLIPRSTTATEIFICPGSKDEPLPEGVSFANGKISYAYYMGRTASDNAGLVLASDCQVNDSAKMTGQSLFSADGKKPGNNHGKTGGNLMLANGEIQFCAPIADRDLPLAGKVRLLNPR